MLNANFNIDGHVHTKLCHHAVGEMEEYVICAINKGLKGIIFLEHFEVGINYFESTWLEDDEFKTYFAVGQELQRKYQGKIKIGLGTEVGYNPLRILEIKEFLGRHDWDRVGLSYHFYEYHGQHINMLSRKQQNMDSFSEIGVSKVISDYLQGLLDGLRQLPVNVLCHLDAALRHHPEVHFDASHKRQIMEILQEMVNRGVTLEINTSGFVHRRKEPYPKEWIVNQATGLGINLVAGSDAHRPQDVGRYFERLI